MPPGIAWYPARTTAQGHAVISVCLADNKSIWNDSQRLLVWALAVEATKELATVPQGKFSG